MPSAEVVVLGAGPAGLAAALRLRAFGHAVALLERRPFPRPQVGEALTPGVWPTLAAIDCSDVLDEVPFRRDLDAVRRWEGPTAERMPAALRGPGGMVDRGAFDLALLRRCRDRGVALLDPDEVRVEGSTLRRAGQPWRPPLVVDARGRGAPGGRIATGAPTLALWVDEADAVAHETRIEATAAGWLWSAPLAQGGRRTLALMDPESARGGAEPAIALALAHARLVAPVPPGLPVRGCDATATVVVAEDPPGWWRAGDAAFTLDPLSSTGVERALRSGLQVALGLHTLLEGGDPTDVADFLRARTAETVATHHRQALAHYRGASVEGAFWSARRGAWTPPAGRPLLDEIAALLSAPVPSVAGELDAERWWGADLRLSPRIELLSLPCVVGDRIERRAAVRHPGLDRPLAFLGEHDVVALLAEVPRARRLDALVQIWSARMPAPEAARLAGWLVRHGLIERAGSASATTHPPRDDHSPNLPPTSSTSPGDHGHDQEGTV